MNDFGESRELFQLRSGRVILDEDMSDKMFLIKQNHPERADETTSGFEWSEMGMANLFAINISGNTKEEVAGMWNHRIGKRT